MDQHIDEILVRGAVRQDALYSQFLLKAVDTVGLGLVDLGHSSHSYLLHEEVFAELFWFKFLYHNSVTRNSLLVTG